MADPVTMMLAGSTVSAGAGLLGAFGTYAQGKGDAANLRRAAGVVDAQTAAEEITFRRQTQQALARQQAAGAQSGIRSGGSLDDVYRQSAIDAELDALNLRYQGRLQASNLRTQAKATKKGATASAILQGASAVANFAGDFGQAQLLKPPKARIQ